MDSTVSKTECYDILKVLTQILVVAGHVTAMYTASGVIPPAVGSNALSTVCHYIYGFHMPLYMFLSGCVYGYCIENGKYRQPARFVANKARRLLLPYLFIGMFWVTPVMVFTHVVPDWKQYLLNGILLAGQCRHLWFLLTLFWIFLLACLARRLFLRAPAAVLVISAGLCVLSQFMPATGFPATLLKPDKVLYYQLFFFAGACLNHWFVRLAAGLKKARWALPVSAAVCVGAVFRSGWPYSLIWAFAGILGMFSLVVNCPRLMRAFCETRFYRWTKQNNFGIYLFHPMLGYLAFFLFGGYRIPAVLFAGLVAVGIFFLSGLMTMLVRKLHLSVVIGE